ncbi:hypothetical protein EYF80_034505 [Liparis tanakae]|uniref:Uncharacterized protein n=1 Tax=Liparis tanakae TaxID=230148 RepID=A0A4Z2GPG8_9TELE|nr:hypothetical protein EYF80_034505 [Liparis tanakae]
MKVLRFTPDVHYKQLSAQWELKLHKSNKSSPTCGLHAINLKILCSTGFPPDIHPSRQQQAEPRLHRQSYMDSINTGAERPFSLREGPLHRLAYVISVFTVTTVCATGSLCCTTDYHHSPEGILSASVLINHKLDSRAVFHMAIHHRPNQVALSESPC